MVGNWIEDIAEFAANMRALADVRRAQKRIDESLRKIKELFAAIDAANAEHDESQRRQWRTRFGPVVSPPTLISIPRAIPWVASLKAFV